MELSSSDKALQVRIQKVLSELDERQRRLYLKAEAESIGWGGISKVSLLSGVCRKS
jgi:hypothetical protein